MGITAQHQGNSLHTYPGRVVDPPNESQSVIGHECGEKRGFQIMGWWLVAGGWSCL